jgi:hypothetical protein
MEFPQCVVFVGGELPLTDVGTLEELEELKNSSASQRMW